MLSVKGRSVYNVQVQILNSEFTVLIANENVMDAQKVILLMQHTNILTSKWYQFDNASCGLNWDK